MTSAPTKGQDMPQDKIDSVREHVALVEAERDAALATIKRMQIDIDSLESRLSHMRVEVERLRRERSTASTR